MPGSKRRQSARTDGKSGRQEASCAVELNPAESDSDGDDDDGVTRLCRYLSSSDVDEPRADAKLLSPSAMDSDHDAPYHRRVGKPVFPQNFLNIPPPDDPPPPADAPSGVGRRPPQRQLPPLPRRTVRDDDDEDESAYEEAKPVAAPRPSKQPYALSQSLVARQAATVDDAGPGTAGGYEVANAAALDSIDGWDHYQASVLERNPETGSFYIPSGSGHTTTSSLSPQSRRIDDDHRNAYSLLPGAATTVPVNVLPLRPELTGGVQQAHKMRPPPPPPMLVAPSSAKGGAYASASFDCSWRSAALALLAALVVALILLSYLFVLYLGCGSQSAYCTESTTFDGATRRAGDAADDRLRPLPESFSLSDTVVADLPAGSLTSTYFTLQQDAAVRFNLTVDARSRLALYGRLTLPPTPTQRDFERLVLGDRLPTPVTSIIKRSTDHYGHPSKNLREASFVQQLAAGRWHLGFLNDDIRPQPIKFSVAVSSLDGGDCPGGCGGHGACRDSTCDCSAGFIGANCEESVCAVVCSGNGLFAGGRCHCDEGWKGAECDLPSNMCEVADCGGRGRCGADGRCRCDPGWAGGACERRVCQDSACSHHGACVDGRCLCEFGWRGAMCEVAYTCGAVSARSACGGRGTANAHTGRCDCEAPWTGAQCETLRCDLDCGLDGVCEDGKCVCADGFSGERCESRLCSPGCEEHGSCDNGTCTCSVGWNGDNCQLEGCPNDCSSQSQGECRLSEASWACRCRSGFTGVGCATALEQKCSDGNDDDDDGLTDCEDSECCQYTICLNHHLCQTVPDPVAVLMRYQPPSPQASFLDKMRFMLDAESVQRYADAALFNESRASVVRGRVLAADGAPLAGVRVTDTANALFGFTISRLDGHFDLLVDGGQSVRLQLMRRPFDSLYRTLHAPPNRIVLAGDVVLAASTVRLPLCAAVVANCSSIQPDEADASASSSCAAAERADVDRARPTVVSSYRLSRFAGVPSPSGQLLVESAAVYESVAIDGTRGLFLNYHSGRAVGFHSSLDISLLSSPLSPLLRLVHLQIDVEGRRFEQTLEAKPNLTYRFYWNRRNVYRQKVYGLTTAKVSIGYRYAECNRVFWTRKQVRMDGFKSRSSALGGWTVNVHHHYDLLNSVLEKGDGSKVYLREQPPLLSRTLGSDRQRPLNCPFCNGASPRVSLFQPLSLAAAADGSLFVGDYNLVRQRTVNGTVRTVLELSVADTTHGYYLAVHPISKHLFVSLSHRRQVWRVRGTDGGAPTDPSTNFVVFAGSGAVCARGDGCGDGGSAQLASLTFPKGVAFDSRGELYVADERSIRVVSEGGLIRSLVGASGEWRTQSCSSSVAVEQLQLQWPTALAVDPLTDTLFFLDSDVVFALSRGGRVARRVVGAPPHCSLLASPLTNATERPHQLSGAVAMAVSADGELLLAESDGRRVNRVRAFDDVGGARLVVGVDSKCDCDRRNCPCVDEHAVTARDGRLHSPLALAVDTAGVLHIADSGNFQVRSVRPASPSWVAATRLLEVYPGDSNELYLFNKFGQHVATKDLLTDRFKYNFTYHIDTSYGRLTHLTGAGGHRVYFTRKSNTQIRLEVSGGYQTTLTLNPFNKMLERVQHSGGAQIDFAYDSDTELLLSRVERSSVARFYEYAPSGRVVGLTSGTGVYRRLHYSMRGGRLIAQVFADSQLAGSFEASELAHSRLGVGSVRLMHGGDSFRLVRNGSTTQLDAATQPLLRGHQTSLWRRKTALSTADGDERLNARLVWRFYVQREGARSLKRVAQINGRNGVSIEYDRRMNADTISDERDEAVLRVHYNLAGAVAAWTPLSGSLSPMNVSYDQLGRVSAFRWGECSEKFVFDRRDRLTDHASGVDGDQLPRKYGYETETSRWPTTVQLPSGSEFQLQYDSTGGLSDVLTPSGERHHFRQLADVGAVVRLRFVAFADRPFVSTFDDAGRLLATLSPDGRRRVHFTYNAEGQLTSLLHDGSATVIRYAGGAVEQARSSAVQRTLEWSGPLRSAMRVRHVERGGRSANANFAYDYDNRLQLGAVHATFADSLNLEPLTFERDASSGQLTRIKHYRLHYDESKLRLSAEGVAVEHVFGADRALVQCRLNVAGGRVANEQYERDSLGRLVKTRRSLANGHKREERRAYNVDGRLNQLTLGEAAHERWTLHYDVDGRLKAVNERNVLLADGLVRSFGRVNYTTDGSGSVVSRGRQSFAYDSFGRLVRAWQPEAFDVHYAYDERSRLVYRETADTTLHLFYALPDKPHLITHTYDRKTQATSALFYDPDDRLFAVETVKRRFFVFSNGERTPELVFADDGSQHKAVVRGPFGGVVSDSRAAFFMPVGHRGHFQDGDTGDLIVRGRPLDTSIGRWLSVDVLELGAPLDVFRPERVDPFHYERHAASPLSHDLSAWLRLSEVDVGGLLPLLGSEDAAAMCDERQTVVQAVACDVRRRVAQFGQLRTRLPSAVLPPRLPAADAPFAADRTVLGDGVVVSSRDGRAFVSAAPQSADTSRRLHAAIVQLVNGSRLLPNLGLSATEGDVVLQSVFWRPDDCADFLEATGLSAANSPIVTANLNLTFTADGAQKSVRANARYSAVLVYCGASFESASEKHRRLVLTRIEAALWNEANIQAANGGESRLDLTPVEKTTLKSVGRVAGYSARFLADEHLAPQLFADHNFWALEKRS